MRVPYFVVAGGVTQTFIATSVPAKIFAPRIVPHRSGFCFV
jgi:hypothetical protein